MREHPCPLCATNTSTSICGNCALELDGQGIPLPAPDASDKEVRAWRQTHFKLPFDRWTKTPKLVGFSDGLWSGGNFKSQKPSLREAALEVYEAHGNDFINDRATILRIIVTDFFAMRAGVFHRHNDGWLLVRLDDGKQTWCHPILTGFGANSPRRRRG